MENNQLDILKDLSAKETPSRLLEKAEEKSRTDAVYATEQINKSDQWLKNNASMKPAQRLEEWMVETKDFMFTPDTVEYYHGIKEELLSSANKGADGKKTNIEDVKDQLKSFQTNEEATAFYRDNAHKWSRDIHNSLGDYFPRVFDIQAQKDLEKGRITQRMAFEQVLRKKELNLDPDVSLESHVRDAVKAFGYDMLDEVTTPDGRISIPINGKEANSFALDDPPMGATEKFIEYNDLVPAAMPIIKERLEKARKEVAQSEELAKKTMFNKVQTNEIPKEFVSNVIIDGAPSIESGISALKKRIERQQEQGKFQKVGGASKAFLESYHDVTETLKRRIEGGRIL
jgi:hypothetical protein